MAFGILDDHSLARVPGTVHLEEQERRQADQSRRQDLKYGVTRGTTVVLVPQPAGGL